MQETKKAATAGKAAKPAAKKTTAKKTAAKKTAGAKTTKKRSVESTISLVKKINFVLQCSARPEGISYNELVENAKNVWKYDMGGKISDIKNLELYVKPEENKVYYVFNGEKSGSFDL